MDNLLCCVLIITLSFSFINCAVISNDDGEQGLYSKSDAGVLILTGFNFERELYGQKYALVVQFYNSFCGHCRAFAPKFKSLARTLVPWKNILRLAVIDCTAEENNDICRNFEIMSYPSVRYFHENYVKGNNEFGVQFRSTGSTEDLKLLIIRKLQSEQSSGRLSFAPSLDIASYASYESAIHDAQNDNYIFLVFEGQNSTVGSELALDINDYKYVKVKRVFQNSELTDLAGIKRLPGLVVVKPGSMETMNLTPDNPSIQTLLKVVNAFLKSRNYEFPKREKINDESDHDDTLAPSPMNTRDDVYYTDLEKTIQKTLHAEIPSKPVLTGEVLQSAINYLKVLISSFPAKHNLKQYLIDLHNQVIGRSEWNGKDLANLVKQLEITHAPVYSSSKLNYIGCKGSDPKYRGYSCGLWTLFHTLTVNAVNIPNEGPKVLSAMHGYVKNFFGCTSCAEHFQKMAANNKIFDVKDNDKAVLWLWISHNQVNLRLAGDITEDPAHPKIQFPSESNCPSCRIGNQGSWNLPAVYAYLQSMYGARISYNDNWTVTASPDAFSNVDLGLLSLLYLSA